MVGRTGRAWGGCVVSMCCINRQITNNLSFMIRQASRANEPKT